MKMKCKKMKYITISCSDECSYQTSDKRLKFDQVTYHKKIRRGLPNPAVAKHRCLQLGSSLNITPNSATPRDQTGMHPANVRHFVPMNSSM